MRKNQLLATMKTCLLVMAGGIMASCADTYDGGENFEGGVRNAQLTSPNADEIVIKESTDGSQMTIEWPVVFGAGGYEFQLLNASDETKPIVNDTIDGCKTTVNREEDMNYVITVRPLGNKQFNNTEAATPCRRIHSTFTKPYSQIPAGDLYNYFQENPISDTVKIEQELNFDLAPGAEYTLSKSIDFKYHKVVLRSTDKSNPVTITLADSANFIVSNDFTLKYAVVDASTCVKPVFEAYKYNGDPDTILAKPGNYFLIDFVRIIGCQFKGVMGSFFYDNNKSWCVVNFLIKNTTIEMNTTTSSVKNESFISFQGGGIKDFTIQNSTIYQKGEGNSKYFLRYNNSVRVDRLGYSKEVDHTTLNYLNNTFYKVASGQWANYSGISNYSIYNIQNNIWYECADGEIARRMMGNGRLGNNCSAIWSYNTYWKNGEQKLQGTYDTGVQLTTDPAFTDPDNFIFLPTGAEQVAKQTGDTRWYGAE